MANNVTRTKKATIDLKLRRYNQEISDSTFYMKAMSEVVKVRLFSCWQLLGLTVTVTLKSLKWLNC